MTATRSEVLSERIRALHPSIRERADQTERARCIPAETIRELTAAGLFRAWVPRRYGGDEQDLLPVFDAMIEMGRVCTSTAWVGSLLTIHNLMIGWFDERAQDEVFSQGPDLLAASSFAPTGEAVRVDGGFRLNGSWPFSSGIDHCTWVMPVSLVADESGGRTPYMFLVPQPEFTVVDDWFVTGLSGTGSKSFVLRDVFVPEHRAESTQNLAKGEGRGMRVNTGPLHRSPRDLFKYIFAPAAIGTALHALGLFRATIAGRRAAYSGEAFREKPGSWFRIAEAAAEIDAARLMLRRDIAEIEGCGAAGEHLPPASLQRLPYDGAFSVELCSRAVYRLFRGSGAKALFQDNLMQRLFRDMHAITQHGAIDLDLAGELYGKALVENPEYSTGGEF